MKKLVALAILAVGSILTLKADSVVVFNEIMYHPSLNESNMEWVELYNPMSVDVDISGWRLDGAVHYTFASNSIVAGGGFVVVASSPTNLAAVTGLTNIYGPFTNRLNNGGDEIQLRNNNDRMMDEVDYEAEGDWPVAPDGSGASLAKRDHDLASGPAENWAASSQLGGTPGAENFASSNAPAVVFNEISSSTDDLFWVELMNGSTGTVVLDGWRIYHDGDTNYDHLYLFPSNGLSLAAGSFLAVTNTTLGFDAHSGDKLYLFAPGGTNVLDGVVLKKLLKGRWPDGTGRWQWPNAPTPGASNSFSFHDEIVINEIMYRHARVLTNGTVPQESAEKWVELYNRSTNTVDLSGWELDGGIRYTFSNGLSMAPGAYLVVAKDAAALRVLYPGVEIIGDLGRNFSGKSDLLVLKDATGNRVNQLRYFDSEPWPEYANGGGSSLELRDPFADNSRAEAWAASDESSKSIWLPVSYSMAASSTNSGQPTLWADFIFGLLGEGECLVDDISVIDLSNGNQVMVGNGDFENGATGWRIIGTHTRSRVEVEPGNPGNHVMHVMASGPQEHMHNHIETTLINGITIVNGHNYQISYRAKWLAGNYFLNTRLYFNRCARTTMLPRPNLTGTPGARNSRYETNIGPTFSQLQHFPVVPAAGAPVTVSVRAEDPQGVSSCELWWSATITNSSGTNSSWQSASMSNSGTGSVYTGTIPGCPAGTIVQMYVRAIDSLGAVATWPADGPGGGALYATADGQANLTLGHNVRIILNPSNTALLHALTNVQSNDRLPCTVVYDEKRAYYNCKVRLRGSERGRYSDVRTTWGMIFPSDDPFRGVHPAMIMHRSGAGDSTSNKQMEVLIRHMLTHAGDIPGTYPDLVRAIPPKSIHTGPVMFAPRHKDLFAETAYPNGGDGIVWKFELIYYPTTTNQYGYKNPNPDTVIGTDISDLGNEEEIYRYNFILKNHRDADDYTQLMKFAKTWSLSGAALDQAIRPVMDVDEWMRAWAFLSLCGVGDTYTFGNNHNLVLYQRPSDLKILAFLWDMSFAFTQSSTAPLVGNMNLSKIINLPGNLRVFYANMLDLIASTYNTSYMTYWANHYVRFCPGQNFSGAISYIQTRGDYAKGVITASNGFAPFAITGSSISGNFVTITGTAPVLAKTILLNGIEYPLSWSNIYTWTITLPMNAVSNVFNFQGYDLSGAAISNCTASISVENTGQVAQAIGNVVINEIQYNPANTNAWFVEIFNRAANFTFDVSGWRIEGLGNYTFPGGTYLTNRQYLILAKHREAFAAAYGSGIAVFDVFEGGLQADGETLTLIMPPPATNDPGVVVDKVRYEPGLPWPAPANNSSLQLIDAAQDNARAGNWAAGAQWRYFSATGNPGTNQYLYFYPDVSGCDLFLDDIRLVLGTNASAGQNLVRNGDFESGSNTFWRIFSSGSTATNLASRSGSYSFRLNAASGGNPAFSGFNQLIDTNNFVRNTNYTLSYWYLSNFRGSNLLTQMGLMIPRFKTTNNTIAAVPYTPGGSNSVATLLPEFPPIWLNEVQPRNVNTRSNRFGEFAPWVELYNPTTNPVELTGLYLANNYTSNMFQWAFPTGAVINAGEYKLIWLDGAESNSIPEEFHANFSIPESTGSVAVVRLFSGLPQVVDYLNYSGVGASLSYGDYPDGQPFSRQIFYRITPGDTNNAEHPVLFINEWVASNLQNSTNGIAGYPNPVGGAYDDWFELYNPNSYPVNLNNFYLTDTNLLPAQCKIPIGYSVPAQGFLVVWADGNPARNSSTNADLHVSFQLNRDGEQIGLYDPNTNLIDLINFNLQTNNISQGRYGDGSGDIYYMANTTPGRPNIYFVNSPPSLPSLPVQYVNFGQILWVTNSATDPDVAAGLQSFTYHLGNGPPGVYVYPSTGVVRWNPMSPGTNQMRVWVEDNGLPRLCATNTFTVVVRSFSLGARLSTDGTSIVLSCAAIPGRHYKIVWQQNLDPLGPWPDLPGYEDVIASSQNLEVTIPIDSGTNAFYRIVQLP